MAKPTRSGSTRSPRLSPTASDWEAAEELWATGHEGAALDMLATLLPARVSVEELAKARHLWPSRLECVHPAVLSDERKARWDYVAAQLRRYPGLPVFKEEGPIGKVDFPVLGRGGLRGRFVSVSVERSIGRQDRLPGRRLVSTTALAAIKTALGAARTLLDQQQPFTVTLTSVGALIEDESLGLAVAVAAISAALEWPIAERFCLTGRLDNNGTVLPVQGIAQKRELLATERPLAELLGPQEAPSLTRAIHHVFRANIARGRARYRSLLRDLVGQADRSRMLIVGLGVSRRVDLLDVYVDPNLLPDESDPGWRQTERELAQACQEATANDAAHDEARRRYHEWTGHEYDTNGTGREHRLAWVPIYESHHALIVCGDPGMGKSTLISRIILRQLDAEDPDEPCPRPLPVLISAGDFVADTDASLGSFVERSARERWPDASPEVLLALSDSFREGRVVLLVDGLNEAATKERRLLLQRIQGWRANHAEARCVLTTRRWSLDTIEIPSGFIIFHLAPLSSEQSYELVSRMSGHPHDGAWKIVEFIRGKPSLCHVVSNPLLLLLASRLNGADLRGLRHWVDIYEHAVPLLFRGPRGAERTDAELRDHIRAWSLVADAMQRQGVVTMREHDVRELLAKSVGKKSKSRDQHVDDLLHAALCDAGLVIRRGPRDLAFWHPSLQEYLAAVLWSSSVALESPQAAAACAETLRPLLRRREQHEALRLTLGRLAFHQGSAHAQLATTLLKNIVESSDSDVLADGARLRLASDAVLDGVPLPAQMKDRLAGRLADRVLRFEDLQVAERLTGIVSRLLHDQQPATDACATLSAVLDVPERLSVEALKSAMTLLAQAAPSSEVALAACQRMYARSQSEKEWPPRFYSWRRSIIPIAALGLLRAGRIPDTNAIKMLAADEGFTGYSDLHGEIVSAALDNASAVAAAARPYLVSKDDKARSGALRLCALACPDGEEAEDFIQSCFERHDERGVWMRTLCRAPAARQRLLAVAMKRGGSAVTTTIDLWLSIKADARCLVDQLLSWLLDQPFSERHELVEYVRYQNRRDPLHLEFSRQLHRTLASVAHDEKNPQVGRAAAWHILLFGEPADDSDKAADRARICRFAKAVPTPLVAEWLVPLLSIEAILEAGAILERMLREGDRDVLKEAVRIVATEDLTRWRRSLWNAIAARAKAAAKSGRSDEVFLCAQAFSGRQAAPGIVAALRILAATARPAAYEAAAHLARMQGLNRDLVLIMLRQHRHVDQDALHRNRAMLRNWILCVGNADDEVLQAVVEVWLYPGQDGWSWYEDVLQEIIVAQPERIDLLLARLRLQDAAHREKMIERISFFLYPARESKNSAVCEAAERWIFDPEVGDAVLSAMERAGVLTNVGRSRIRTLAERPDPIGAWAAEIQAGWGEPSPRYWQDVTAKLAAADLDEVLTAANLLLEQDQRPAALVPALRGCRTGTAQQALRAAFLLYACEEEVRDFLPRLHDCLSVHEVAGIFWEQRSIEKRRRRYGIRPCRSWNNRMVVDNETGAILRQEKYPEPQGRERFRPDFSEQRTPSEFAACLLAEMEFPEVIPVLIQWLGETGDSRTHLALELLRFLDAQNEPGVADWLLAQVRGAHLSWAGWASERLIELDLSHGRHVAALIDRARGSRDVARAYAITSVLTLCTRFDESAYEATQLLDGLPLDAAWRIARWLLCLGHSTPQGAKTYVAGEIELHPMRQRDRPNGEGQAHLEQTASAQKFDERRLYSDPLIIAQWASTLADGTPASRTDKAERLLRWIYDSGQDSLRDSPLLTEGSLLGSAVRSALRAGLLCDDIWIQGLAIQKLDEIGAIDDLVKTAAMSCLHATFGDEPLRSFWGTDKVDQATWEEWQGGVLLQVARVLIRHNCGAECMAVLHRAARRVPRGANGDSFWTPILNFLVEQGDSLTTLHEPLRRWLAARGAGALFFEDVLSLLWKSGSEPRLIRAAVLDHLAEGNHYAPHLVHRWATGGPVYENKNESGDDSAQDAAWKSLLAEERFGGTAANRLQAQLKWIVGQNIPDDILRPAMTVLACHYDLEQAALLDRILTESPSHAQRSAELERLLTRADDAPGQRLAKAWLLSEIDL